MNRAGVIGIVVGVTIAAGFIIWMVRNFGNQGYQWYESYRPSSDQPYGLSYTIDLLDRFQDKKTRIIKNDLIGTLQKSDADNYLFIGVEPLYTEEMTTALLDWVGEGHQAVIASVNLPDTLLNVLFPDNIGSLSESFAYDEDAEELLPEFTRDLHGEYKQKWLDLNFRYPDLPEEQFRFTYRVKDKKEVHTWYYFNIDSLRYPSSDFRPVCTDDYGNPYMLDMKVGQGHLYLFTNPVLLTNIYAVDSNKIPFFNIMFSHLKEGEIMLDEFSKMPSRQQNAGQDYDSPLRFIMSDPSLRSAWYTLLAAAFLFLIFRGRREQQIIPLAEPNVNRSLEFAMTVGRMHYLRGDHLHLVRQQMRIWRAFVRDKYQLVAGEDRSEFIKKLAAKSQVPEIVIRDILDTWDSFSERLSLKEKEMTDFYTKTRTFYKSCQ